MSTKNKASIPPVVSTPVIWFTYDPREGFKMHISECSPQFLKANQTKEFLPDLKPIVLSRAEMTMNDIMDRVREGK